MNKEQFLQMLNEKGIALSEKQMTQFDQYFHLLVEWNEKMNLTAITEEQEVYLKHFFDSISASFFIDFTEELTVCDVGAGAGFPSIPLAICFPTIQVTIVDSLNKRITFLENLTKELGLTNVRAFHDRAETFAQNKDHREQYDIVTARAVARLSVLSELCLPLAKVGGRFIAMKAASGDDELAVAKKAITTMGAKVNETYRFMLPLEDSERVIFDISKTKQTPKKYPRKAGTPNKTPIE